MASYVLVSWPCVPVLLIVVSVSTGLVFSVHPLLLLSGDVMLLLEICLHVMAFYLFYVHFLLVFDSSLYFICCHFTSFISSSSLWLYFFKCIWVSEVYLVALLKIMIDVEFWCQAVLKQFSGGGYGGPDNVLTDESELQQHQKLEKLYISTRAGKVTQCLLLLCNCPVYFFLTFVYPFLSLAFPKGYCPWCGRFHSYWVQASWNRWAAETVFFLYWYFISCCFFIYVLAIFITGTKLSEDSRKYGVENTCTSGSTLSKAALSFARARAQMEKERGNLLKALGTKVWSDVIVTLISKNMHAQNMYLTRNKMPARFSPNCWKLCCWTCSTTSLVITKSKLLNDIGNISFH